MLTCVDVFKLYTSFEVFFFVDVYFTAPSFHNYNEERSLLLIVKVSFEGQDVCQDYCQDFINTIPTKTLGQSLSNLLS